MSKEHLANLNQLSQAELKKKLGQLPEPELRQLHEQAIVSGDYSLQILLCRALLVYEERRSLALTSIKELENYLSAKSQKNYNT